MEQSEKMLSPRSGKFVGNRRLVAEALGVSERTAYRMLERHGYRSAGDR